MMNPADKDGKRLFERGHPLYQYPMGHKAEGLPSFDEVAAGGVTSPRKCWATRSSSEQAEYEAKIREAQAFIVARNSDPNYEPEAVGDPSREWIRRLAKTDPDRCRAILRSVSLMPQDARGTALRQAYTKNFYYKQEG